MNAVEASEHLMETLMFVPRNSGVKSLGHAWTFMTRVCEDIIETATSEARPAIRNKIIQVSRRLT